MTRDSKAVKLHDRRGVATSLISGIYRQAVGHQMVPEKVMVLSTEIFCTDDYTEVHKLGIWAGKREGRKCLGGPLV